MPKPGGGGIQTSLVGAINMLGSWFQRRQPSPAAPSQGRGAPIYSPGYNWGNQFQPGPGNAPDISQFSQTFQPSGGFFAPGYPLVPVEREALRRFNFPVGINYQYTPRSYEPIGYEELRFLAKEDLVAMAIETRKDQFDPLDWAIKPRGSDGAPKKGKDKRIDAVTEFWQYPDGENNFHDWLREALHEVLTTDALAFEPIYNNAGQFIRLDPIDGSTIKVLIDDTGRRPEPPAPAFEQIIHGRPWVLLTDGSGIARRISTDDEASQEFTAQQLMYCPRVKRINHLYGFPPTEQIFLSINTRLRRAIMQLQYFTEGNVPRGFMQGAEGWTPEQIQQQMDFLNDKLAGNTAERTRIVLVPHGSEYQSILESPLKDESDEWWARIICYAFSLPPTAFIKPQNRSTAEQAGDTALDEGREPLKAWVKRLIDGVIQRRMGYADLEFAWADDNPVDPKVQADIIKENVASAVYTVNEARDLLGLDPLQGGDEPVFITSQGPILLRDVEANSSRIVNPPMPLPPMIPKPENAGEGPEAKVQPEERSGKAPVGGSSKKPGNGRQKPANSGEKPSKEKEGEAAKKASLPFLPSGPAGRPMKLFLARAIARLSREIESFFKAEAHRTAADIASTSVVLHLSTLPLRGGGLDRSSRSVQFADLRKDANRDQQDVKPADQHRDAELAAGTAVALAAIKFDRWTDLVGKTQAELEAVGNETVARSLAALGAHGPVSGAEPAIADMARQRAAELVGQKWIGDRLVADPDAERDIAASTPDMIRDVVSEGLRQRLSVEDLAARLLETVAFSPARALRIATYEVTSAFHLATLEAFKASSRVQASRWRTAGDEKVEAVCQENEDAGPVPLGHRFPSGHLCPLAHLSCRCELEAVFIGARKVSKMSLLDRLQKGDHVDPAYARPVRLPLADPIVEADIQHTSWELVREAMRGDRAMVVEERLVPVSLILATQAVVDDERVARDAAAYREHGQDQDELPIVIERDGQYAILAGHHHCEAAVDCGAQELRVGVLVAVRKMEIS